MNVRVFDCGNVLIDSETTLVEIAKKRKLLVEILRQANGCDAKPATRFSALVHLMTGKFVTCSRKTSLFNADCHSKQGASTSLAKGRSDDHSVYGKVAAIVFAEERGTYEVASVVLLYIERAAPLVSGIGTSSMRMKCDPPGAIVAMYSIASSNHT